MLGWCAAPRTVVAAWLSSAAVVRVLRPAGYSVCITASPPVVSLSVIFMPCDCVGARRRGGGGGGWPDTI